MSHVNIATTGMPEDAPVVAVVGEHCTMGPYSGQRVDEYVSDLLNHQRAADPLSHSQLDDDGQPSVLFVRWFQNNIGKMESI